MRLMTHSGPFVRGIHLTLHVTLGAPLPASGRRGSCSLADASRAAPSCASLGDPPQLTHAVGHQRRHLHAAQSADGREVQVIVVLDNLVKGAGGQALQAMNLALGLPETPGLLAAPVFPI